MLKTTTEVLPVLTAAMLRRLDRPGPCYTSYPTAVRRGQFPEVRGLTLTPDDLVRRAVNWPT